MSRGKYSTGYQKAGWHHFPQHLREKIAILNVRIVIIRKDHDMHAPTRDVTEGMCILLLRMVFNIAALAPPVNPIALTVIQSTVE